MVGLAGIEMRGMPEYLILPGIFVVLALLTRPVSWRLLARLAAWVDARAAVHQSGTDDPDRDDDALLMYRRDRLCADLRRIEHLLTTDMWMSATRQLGNRLAYDQLVDELRRIPDIPNSYERQTLDWWNESKSQPLWGDPLTTNGYSEKSPAVEILDIGWRRPKS
jgi:hypothetical protein